ncbi:MAG: aminotransferase class I/II-fold pyridoxal phosphate-dependent enzyme, partial [Bdellovibrionales bacterium]|nr:aminotransferase class I/II-fold pyridoxal phosphate-dependent enzyme [Bdellovibrionales bacterium]
STGKHIVLLHTCCHNPTGGDLSEEQFEVLLKVFTKREDLFALFDFAYQGFGRGVEEDAFAVRLFAQAGLPFAVCQSASKNCSMYGQRVGCLSIVVDSDSEKEKVEGVLTSIVIRRNYSNPPKYGAELVARVMSNPQLKTAWLEELNEIRERIGALRIQFVEALSGNGLGDRYAFIKNEIGMFSVLGTSAEQDAILRKEFGIYLPDGGRVAIPCLTASSTRYLAAAIARLN